MGRPGLSPTGRVDYRGRADAPAYHPPVLIPLSTDRPLRHRVLVTKLLIAANILVFLAFAALEARNPEAYERLLRQLWIQQDPFHWWGLWTSAFLHGGTIHLLGNMLFLWAFGPNLEDRLGKLGFLAFYLLGAGAASGLHAVFETAPAIGASGAVSAVTGAYLVMFPRTSIRCLFFISLVQIPAWWFIGFSIAWDILRSGSGSGIAHLAHLGGTLFGVGVAFGLLGTRILQPEPYDLFMMFRQRRRREQIRSAVEHSNQHRPLSANGRRKREEAADRAGTRRAEVSRLHAEGKIERAGAEYKVLLSESGADRALLSRRAQYDLGAHFFGQGDYQTAATTFQRFLKGYPEDREVPEVKLMLGLINARYLNDPIEARRLLEDARQRLREPSQRELAESILEDLG